ncbi:class C beta-lactamase-related serine hydrolase [Candidatus Heimdallarchaeota archaeon]|nr:MAG: class C beta-lactamase-related serine hydrolase [Candidatus Heimdallarchaeota archaeon]
MKFWKDSLVIKKTIKSRYSHQLFSIILISILYSTLSLTVLDEPVTAVIRDYWPTDEWQESSPEEQGMSSEKLAEVDKTITEGGYPINSYLIIKNGYIIDEHYYYGYNDSTIHQLFSVTKSFLSALYGIAIEKGYVSLDQKMINFFPDRNISNFDERKEEITIEDLLTMTSGLKWSESTTDSLWFASDDQIQFVLDRPMEHEPGEVFNYNSGSSHILSAILQNVTGKTTLQFVEDYLFNDLGIIDYSWAKDPSGVYYGSHGLSLTPRDMAKFGFLYLNNGTWDTEIILQKEWVQESTMKKINVSQKTNYGYLWWLNPNLQSYQASGFLGQRIFVFPKYDLIVVYTATTFSPSILEDLIEDYILPAIDGNNTTTGKTTITPIMVILGLVVIGSIKANKNKRD